MCEMSNTPRRAPTPDQRQLDPERTRRRLLDAAMEEFAAHGYAGARVAGIAGRAGVNKQMISYHFGGKEGLYQALHAEWVRKEAGMSDVDLSLPELAPLYLRKALSDPRALRLMLWQALSDDTGQTTGEEPGDLTALRRRQAAGELAADLDPRVVLLVLMAATAAPVTMPREVVRLLGMDPASGEFEAHYAEQLSRLVAHLAQPPSGAPSS
jgi:TetR/AcrR family transcriptional regulator